MLNKLGLTFLFIERLETFFFYFSPTFLRFNVFDFFYSLHCDICHWFSPRDQPRSSGSFTTIWTRSSPDHQTDPVWEHSRTIHKV